MAEAIVSDVVAKLLESLGQSVVEEMAPYFNGRKKLKELEQLMGMIQARLLDAERIREGDNGALINLWLKRLKHVLYRLEDLFEEVVMIDQDELPRGKLTKPLGVCYSCLSPFKVNKKLALESKAIMEELKSITSEMHCLNLRVHSIEVQSSVSRVSWRETHLFVLEKDVIGRDADKKAILEMVLHCDDIVGESVLVIIPIVGIGGLGKTTLAQLVFNDDDVHKHFELKGWACISEVSNLEELLRKILKSIDKSDCHQLNMEQLQSCLREAVNDKKFLLVLDDVWDEDRERWLCLRRLLCGCKRGSKIIVTSRSRVVADNMGTVEAYALGVLQEDMSWALFKGLAFKEGQEHNNEHLTRIGKEIVGKCGHVPLAIRTIASLLYTKDTEQEWEYFKDSELGMIEQCETSIMSSLKLSYDHLAPHLKQCFAYCSLFTKDYEFDKMDLIYLWMAQGFLKTTRDHVSPEDVGHGYFMELLRRSFFQDVRRNEYGEIISCKMHDLMNDLAKNVAGYCCLLVDKPTMQINDKNVWHASFTANSTWNAPPWLIAAKQIRSLLLTTNSLSFAVPDISKTISSLRCLRALDLPRMDNDSLPDSIKQLKHLRYLKISVSSYSLPECITGLQKLQTLDLRECWWLRELPRELHKLTSLRHLLCRSSIALTDMPPGFERLTSLQTLNLFVVGECTGLDALTSFNDLAGKLKICFSERRGKAVSVDTGAILKATKLTSLELTWWALQNGEPACHSDKVEDELALNCLQPPPSLKSLQVEGWRGARFPGWGMDVFPSPLPNLVSIEIARCEKCQILPPFNLLPLLRSLELWYLEALECIRIGGLSSVTSSSSTAFFPSLERLVLFQLPVFKGWSEQNNINQQEPERPQDLLQPSSFPCLSKLFIGYCPKLMSMPKAPRLESLGANSIHNNLLKYLLYGDATQISVPSSLIPSMLKDLHIRSIHELDTLSINLITLESLSIYFCLQLIRLTVKAPTCLRNLEIHNCVRLKDISSALQHLTVLEELKISDCDQLVWEPIMGKDNVSFVDEGRDVSSITSSDVKSADWQGLKSLRLLTLKSICNLDSPPQSLGCLRALQELEIYHFSNLIVLPEWIGHLTQLRRLDIQDCLKLVTLPESLRNLTNLQRLEVRDCDPELTRRCKQPDGEYWPLIQHIPHIELDY
ncbi:putative disease resistance protein RGA4 [Chenopodium quinoa]|uniref:putative disease resistance protein RGA4 n=1 Tax=Chenopodium quinoa TaxID=63459 RepID=UPI000B778DB2|nr:putative disease resistance protein RGA4 [Chenopodium quinoa]